MYDINSISFFDPEIEPHHISYFSSLDLIENDSIKTTENILDVFNGKQFCKIQTDNTIKNEYDISPNNNFNEKTDYTDKNSKNFDLKKRGKNSRKFGTDNILTKVNGHFINFLVNFINILLGIFDIDEKFIKIDYKYKKKVTKKDFSNLKDSVIGEILKQYISPKFTTLKKEKNSELYKKIETIPSINKIFSEKYIDIFKNIYYKNERIINIKKDDKNIVIKLPRNEVKLFEDLIEKNKEDHLYIERLKDLVFNEFIRTEF